MRKKIMGILVLLQNALIANGEALIDENVSFLNLPKAELHLHLGGSYPKKYLFSIATPIQQEELETKLEWIAKGVNYHDAFSVFQLVSDIVNSEEKVQRGVEELCLSLQEDNVSYVEIRTGLKNLGKGYEAYLKAVLEGIKASKSNQFEANLLLSLQRNSTFKTAKMTIDLALKYQSLGVCGIDISGNSTIGEIQGLMPELLRAREEGLFFVVHLGESQEEQDQMLLLEALQPRRIGHGVHLKAEARDWILKEKIPMEVCLSSSVLVKMIDQYDQHPGIQFFRLGHPIVFCTDDPLLFSTTLSKELAIANQLCGLSSEEVERIVMSSFEHALKNAKSNELSTP